MPLLIYPCVCITIKKKSIASPMCSTQWVGISSRVIGNSIVPLFSSILRVAAVCYSEPNCLSPGKILRCWIGLRLGNWRTDSNSFPSEHICTGCCSTPVTLHLPLFLKSLGFQEHSPPKVMGLGSMSSAFCLSTLFLSLY